MHRCSPFDIKPETDLKKLLSLLLIIVAITAQGQTFDAFRKRITAADTIIPSKTERYYWTDEGFCGAFIWLRSDSTFYREGACENHGYFNSGKWSQECDTITLIFTPIRQFNLFFAMNTSGTAKDTLTVEVRDRNGNPIIGGVEGYWIGALGKDSEYYYTDSFGLIRIPLKGVDSIEFENVSGKRGQSVFPVKHLPAHITLYLDVNEIVPFCEYIAGPLIYIEGREKWKFQKTRISLISDDQVWDRFEK